VAYIYAVRGWLELSWPDAEVEGVDESAEEHAAKIERIRDLLTTSLSPEELNDEDADESAERVKAGWGFPQHALAGTEYVFYGGDVEQPRVVLEQIRAVLAIDPFADGYFSVEGEDGQRFRQWIIKGGTIYGRNHLFPDFDEEGVPEGYEVLK
jgi:hypothetical protein